MGYLERTPCSWKAETWQGQIYSGPNELWQPKNAVYFLNEGFFGSYIFFTIDFAIFLLAFCWAHFLSFIKLSFWQVFMRGAQTSKKNKSDEERKEKKEGISDKLEIGNY